MAHTHIAEHSKGADPLLEPKLQTNGEVPPIFEKQVALCLG